MLLPVRQFLEMLLFFIFVFLFHFLLFPIIFQSLSHSFPLPLGMTFYPFLQIIFFLFLLFLFFIFFLLRLKHATLTKITLSDGPLQILATKSTQKRGRFVRYSLSTKADSNSCTLVIRLRKEKSCGIGHRLKFIYNK